MFFFFFQSTISFLPEQHQYSEFGSHSAGVPSSKGFSTPPRRRGSRIKKSPFLSLKRNENGIDKCFNEKKTYTVHLICNDRCFQKVVLKLLALLGLQGLPVDCYLIDHHQLSKQYIVYFKEMKSYKLVSSYDFYHDHSPIR